MLFKYKYSLLEEGVCYDVSRFVYETPCLKLPLRSSTLVVRELFGSLFAGKLQVPVSSFCHCRFAFAIKVHVVFPCPHDSSPVHGSLTKVELVCWWKTRKAIPDVNVFPLTSHLDWLRNSSQKAVNKLCKWLCFVYPAILWSLTLPKNKVSDSYC